MGVFSRGEVGFDQLPSEGYRVGGLKMEAARNSVEDGSRNISPGVCTIFDIV